MLSKRAHQEGRGPRSLSPDLQPVEVCGLGIRPPVQLPGGQLRLSPGHQRPQRTLRQARPQRLGEAERLAQARGQHKVHDRYPLHQRTTCKAFPSDGQVAHADRPTAIVTTVTRYPPAWNPDEISS